MHQFAVKRSAQPQHWLSNIDAVTIRPASIELSKKTMCRAASSNICTATPLLSTTRKRQKTTRAQNTANHWNFTSMCGWSDHDPRMMRDRVATFAQQAFPPIFWGIFYYENKVFAWYRKSKMNIDEHVSPSWRCESNSDANCPANSNLQIWTWNFCAFVRDILQKYTTLQFSILLFSTLICSSPLFFVFFCTFFCAALLVSALLYSSLFYFSLA